jgi:PAS domain-containing protein
MARELRQLVDTANAPIFGIDKLGRVNEWNNKTAEITGFSRDEVCSFLAFLIYFMLVADVLTILTIYSSVAGYELSPGRNLHRSFASPFGANSPGECSPSN